MRQQAGPLLEPTAAADKGAISVEDAKELLAEAPEGEENIRRSIRDFRRDFGDLLADSKIETLVVFIDDLDRCLPDTIIDTLEAIKLFLFVPGTAFVIGADERLVQYAVRQRFPELPGTETEVGPRSGGTPSPHAILGATRTRSSPWAAAGRLAASASPHPRRDSALLPYLR